MTSQVPIASIVLSLDEVEDLSYRMLTASGASELQARPTALSIRAAEADGIRTVGLSYLPTYCEHVACGKVLGQVVPTVATPRAAAVVVDAHHGFAHAAFVAGAELLIEATRTCGVGVLSIGHSYSAGDGAGRRRHGVLRHQPHRVGGDACRGRWRHPAATSVVRPTWGR